MLGPMNKAFTRESDTGGDDDDDAVAAPLPAGGRNYMTPQGYARLRAELLQLIDDERPKVVEVVHWAASNGDRSENGDYLYGKKRLREIDRRIRFLTKRLEIAELARSVGFVFQNYALFRHMTIARNVAFGLEVMPRERRPPARVMLPASSWASGSPT